MRRTWRTVKGRSVLVCSVLATCAAIGAPARAGEAPFFQGKTITITVGSSPGGLYDSIARAMARQLGRHIDGHPAVIVQNKLGAGGTAALAYLVSAAPQDGTALGMIKRSYAIDPLFDATGGVQYDPTRLAAIGSTSADISVAVAWHAAKVKRFEDTYTTELSVGASSATDGTVRYAKLAKNLTPARLRIVPGYPGGNEISLAMERGEVDARFGWSWGAIKSRARDWLQDQKINILMQMGMAKTPDLPDTPFIFDYAKSDLDRRALELIFTPTAMAWPLVAAPNVPAERIAELRHAFAATMIDPDFIAAAASLELDLDPIAGADIDAIVRRISTYDAAAVQRARELTGP
jgi:tripartite-type tricarboxylate transporter receptor subunit TctC